MGPEYSAFAACGLRRAVIHKPIAAGDPDSVHATGLVARADRDGPTAGRVSLRRGWMGIARPPLRAQVVARPDAGYRELRILDRGLLGQHDRLARSRLPAISGRPFRARRSID